MWNIRFGLALILGLSLSPLARATLSGPASSAIESVYSGERPNPQWSDWVNAESGAVYAKRMFPNYSMSDFLDRLPSILDRLERGQRYRLNRRIWAMLTRNPNFQAQFASDHSVVIENFSQLTSDLVDLPEEQRFKVLAVLENILKWPQVDRDLIRSSSFPAPSKMRRVAWLTRALAKAPSLELLPLVKTFIELIDDGSLVAEIAESLFGIPPTLVSSFEDAVNQFCLLVEQVYPNDSGVFLSPARGYKVTLLYAVRHLYSTHPADAAELMSRVLESKPGESAREHLDRVQEILHAIWCKPELSQGWASNHDYEEFLRGVGVFRRGMDSAWEDFQQEFRQKSEPKRAQASRTVQKDRKKIFTILGIEPHTPPQKVKTAFYKAVRFLHPDQNPGRSKEEQAKPSEKFSQLMEAWDAYNDQESQ